MLCAYAHKAKINCSFFLCERTKSVSEVIKPYNISKE